MSTDLRLAVPALAAWLTAALVVGTSPRTGLMVAVLAAAAATVLGAVAWPRRRRGRPAAGTAVLALACAAAVALSAGAQSAGRERLPAEAAGGASATVEGSVRSVPLLLDGPGPPRVQVTLDLDRASAHGVDQAASGPITVFGDAEHWGTLGYGARVRGEGRLALRDSEVLLRADGPPEVLSGPSPALVARIHDALDDVTADLSPQARGLVPGISIGDTTHLDADLDAAMRTTSLTHITAVSGSHFAIVVSVVAALVAPARRPVRALVTATAMAGFVLLVHPQPSVLRAGGMGVVGVLALVLGRPSRAVAALGTAVVVLVVADPWLARSYGFVLSTLATAGLALGSPPLARRLAPRCGRVLAAALAVPIAAQAAVAPVLVLLDPAVTLYAVPANLVAAPAFGPATVLGLGAALLSPVWPGAAHVLAQLAGVCTGWIAAVATTLAGLPGARLPWPAGAGGVVLLAAVTLGVVVVLARRPVAPAPPLDVRAALRSARPSRMAVAAATALALFVAAWGALRFAAWTSAPPGDWIVAACDVGQGDALAVRSGPRSALLVDVGPDAGSVRRCLDGLGVERVDLLVLSHFHADHVGGLAGVLDRPVVAALIPGPGGHDPADRERVTAALGAVGVDCVVAATGTTGEAGTTRFRVLQAADAAAARTGNESLANDSGVVLWVEADGVGVVVLGDLEETGQARLARTAPGPVDVLKIAHHGSRSQSERLARLLSPRVGLVSVGENTYGHPTDRALDLYREQGTVLARTDECGTVAVVRRDGRIAVAGCG